MLCCEVDDQRVQDAVDFFSDYDIHKSHGRAIGRDTAKKYLHHVRNAETIPGLADMMRSLHNQYELFFDQTPFYKLFEDARGTSWGRQMQAVNIKLPLPSQPPE